VVQGVVRWPAVASSVVCAGSSGFTPWLSGPAFWSPPNPSGRLRRACECRAQDANWLVQATAQRLSTPSGRGGTWRPERQAEERGSKLWAYWSIG